MTTGLFCNFSRFVRYRTCRESHNRVFSSASRRSVPSNPPHGSCCSTFQCDVFRHRRARLVTFATSHAWCPSISISEPTCRLAKPTSLLASLRECSLHPPPFLSPSSGRSLPSRLLSFRARISAAPLSGYISYPFCTVPGELPLGSFPGASPRRQFRRPEFRRHRPRPHRVALHPSVLTAFALQRARQIPPDPAARYLSQQHARSRHRRLRLRRCPLRRRRPRLGRLQ